MIDACIAIADRLRSQVGEQFATMGMAAEFAALESMPRTSPALYLLPVGETAQPSETLTRNTQRHECAFAVLLLLRHAGDASGMKSAQTLQALRASVQTAIVNWAPGEDCAGIQFVSGELGELMDSTTIWSDQFTFDRWIRHD